MGRSVTVERASGGGSGELMICLILLLYYTDLGNYNVIITLCYIISYTERERHRGGMAAKSTVILILY